MLHVALYWAVALWPSTADAPVTSLPIAPRGATFSEWKHEGDDATYSHDACAWWDGTFYYDPGACDAFSITRVASGDVATALERASHCAVVGETDCVLNGEIGFAIPAAFLYDADTAEMRMLIAPRYLPPSGTTETATKTIKMQDPNAHHANQLFEFNSTITVEFLKGGARTLETEVLTGQHAYCVQALRRSIAPACWQTLD
jgi:hypothetical protein